MEKNLPNIILIVCDTLGAKHMSLYGYERQTTPKLEKLAAKEGFAIYDNCYATSYWTIPSHASLFTGLYASEHGEQIKKFFLPDHVTTLPEVMKEIGYRTIGISSNNIIGTGTNFHRGFEKFIELEKWMVFAEETKDFTRLKQFLNSDHKGGSLSKALNCLRWAFSEKCPTTAFKFLTNRIYRSIKTVYNARFCVTTNSTPYTMKALRRGKKLIFNSRPPWFLFINVMQTHYKYNPPQVTKGVWSDQKSPYRNHTQHPFRHYSKPFKREVIDYFRDLYDEEVLFLDNLLVSFYNTVKNKLGDNSVFIITSDHGEHFGEDGHFSHILSLHDAVLKIPLLIRFPYASIQGRDKRLVQINDLFATLSDLTESPIPYPSSSFSLLSSNKRIEGRAEMINPDLWPLDIATVRKIETNNLRIIK